jgi:outer membrane protein OmpA-like peptidoglycan-associated protein
MRNQRVKFISGIMLFFLLCVGLTACSRDERPAYISNPIYKNLSLSQRQLLDSVKANDIQVIKEGMRFTFVIPTDKFFKVDTRELKSCREKTLDQLAQFIDSYTAYFEHPRVLVSGYTDKVWLSPARDQLSLHYANRIAEYLREDGISSARIRVRGMGAKEPIASNQYSHGTVHNRRVMVVVY